MAHLKGNVLGNLSGKLGNLSARTVYGRTILAARPSSFRVSDSPDSIAARAKFAVTIGFIKAILMLGVLDEIWSKVKLPGMSVFNTVFKMNRQYVDADKPTLDNIITPGGFGLPVYAAVLDANGLTFDFNALNTVALISRDEVNLSITGLVVYHNPIDPDDETYSIISLSKEEVAFDFTAAYNGSINFDVVQQATAAKYQASIVYISVATKDAEGDIIQHSATFPQAS